MGENRRKGEAVVGPGTVARALLLCVAIAGLGIHYVRMHAEQHAMGLRIIALEREERELLAEIEGQTAMENELLTRPRLLEAVQRFGLMLATPSPSQRLNIEVTEPARGAGAAPARPGRADVGGAMAVLGAGANR